MSGSTGRRTPSPEASWLHANWNQDALGQYAGKWIAVKGSGVERADTDLDRLIEATIGFDPLYAFVHLAALQ